VLEGNPDVWEVRPDQSEEEMPPEESHRPNDSPLDIGAGEDQHSEASTESDATETSEDDSDNSDFSDKGMDDFDTE
jgi:hypothetical protein